MVRTVSTLSTHLSMRHAMGTSVKSSFPVFLFDANSKACLRFSPRPVAGFSRT